MRDALDRLGHLADAAPDDIDTEPLTDASLTALRRLARHHPPPDPHPLRRRAAVLVALFGSRKGDLNVLLSTRSTKLRSHPGEVALPGGKMDPQDMNLEATARREASEEIGLPQSTATIRYLCSLAPVLTRSALLVTPIVALILDYSLKPDLNPSEVVDIFSHPLEGFLCETLPATLHHCLPRDVLAGTQPYHTAHDMTWQNGHGHRFHTFQNKHHAVVGLTAGILIDVAAIAFNRRPEFAVGTNDQLSPPELIAYAIARPPWTDDDGNATDNDDKPKSKL